MTLEELANFTRLKQKLPKEDIDKLHPCPDDIRNEIASGKYKYVYSLFHCVTSPSTGKCNDCGLCDKKYPLTLDTLMSPGFEYMKVRNRGR